jgi:DNA-binding GntR family transcriptional regulator
MKKPVKSEKRSDARLARKATTKVAGKQPKPRAAPESQRSASQTEAAVDLIRSQIIGLSLEPGSKLDEPLLINHFKLGRTPAREAISRLIAEGLVNSLPNRGGTFVRNLNLAEIGEVIFAYQLVETVLGQLCRFDDPSLVEDLEEIQARYTQQIRQKSFLGITSVNEEFHLRMHRSIGNALFYEFALSTHRHVRRLLVLLYKLENAAKSVLETQLKINMGEHLEIIAAIRKKDRRALSALLPAHARQAQTRLLSVMNGSAVPSLSIERSAIESLIGATD